MRKFVFEKIKFKNIILPLEINYIGFVINNTFYYYKEFDDIIKMENILRIKFTETQDFLEFFVNNEENFFIWCLLSDIIFRRIEFCEPHNFTDTYLRFYFEELQREKFNLETESKIVKIFYKNGEESYKNVLYTIWNDFMIYDNKYKIYLFDFYHSEHEKSFTYKLPGFKSKIVIQRSNLKELYDLMNELIIKCEMKGKKRNRNYRLELDAELDLTSSLNFDLVRLQNILKNDNYFREFYSNYRIRVLKTKKNHQKINGHITDYRHQ
ncbi:hypothetical protein EDEG_00831 [Edhazardia aedis USNM 41457]|uniref:Uncharacterized protein n=1 Tax=Edhazardia aedis (strain USNM 41457) TaxID=1003232 RepID=J9DR75_EDHAE|nr:hypothetical protein EDEG_00831 [Edhazardia aedis USNM 41457]|eukprot:EJW05050.1 hypothetical protein EDEG_00831 [Edhazardia aedis USNM 41457]